MMMSSYSGVLLTTRSFAQRAEDLEWWSLILSLRELAFSVLQKQHKKAKRSHSDMPMGAWTLFGYGGSCDDYWTATKFMKQNEKCSQYRIWGQPSSISTATNPYMFVVKITLSICGLKGSISPENMSLLLLTVQEYLKTIIFEGMAVNQVIIKLTWNLPW